MKIEIKRNPEPTDVLFRIKRGLAAYVSYLAACEMNQAFSEYVLYEPLLRILTARGYTVECESECPGIQQPRSGDRKRIDFVARGHSVHFALEVKWAKKPILNIERDLEKLQAFHRSNPDSRSFLCVFGRKIHLSDITFSSDHFTERGKPVYADLRKTKYGCRIYELERVRPEY